MKIRVTQQDIDYGRRQECTKCPVAIAINRCIPNRNWKCLVGVNEVSFELGIVKMQDPGPISCLPQSATEFIRRFDAELPVEPFEFEFEFPMAVL